MDKIFIKEVIPEELRYKNKNMDTYFSDFTRCYTEVIITLLEKGLNITEAFETLYNSPWQKMNEVMGVHGYSTPIFLEKRILNWLDKNKWDVDRISKGKSIDPEVLL